MAILRFLSGIGLSILAATQWNYLHKHGYSIDIHDRPELLNDVVVTCYCCLPLRTTSRIWGWLTRIELPVSLRPKLYRFYANLFHANLDEVELDLSAFPNLVEFFVRALKQNARPIAPNANMVSPADGKILYFGPVTSCRVEQVKGVTYDLRQFLGDTNSISNIIADNYVNSLLKNPLDNRLYQLIIYLAPGDYHRFHSPTDWNIKLRRHFPGMFFTAIGATNVGSIKVYCDGNLATNTVQWPEISHPKEASLDNACITKGELFGEFRLGSTIVLLFEAPRDFRFCLQVGQTIKVGQALSTHFNDKPDERRIERQHLIMDVAQDWKHIWKPKI